MRDGLFERAKFARAGLIFIAVLLLTLVCLINYGEAQTPFDTPVDATFTEETLKNLRIRWKRAVEADLHEVICDTLVSHIMKFVEYDRWNENSARMFVNITYETIENPKFIIQSECAEKLLKTARFFHLVTLIAGPEYAQSAARKRTTILFGEDKIDRWRSIHEFSLQKTKLLELPPSDPRLPMPLESRNPDMPTDLNQEIRNLMLKVLFLASPEPDSHFSKSTNFEVIMSEALKARAKSFGENAEDDSSSVFPVGLKDKAASSKLNKLFEDPSDPQAQPGEFFSSNRLLAPFTVNELMYEMPLLTNFWYTSVLLHYPTGLSAWRTFQSLKEHMKSSDTLSVLDEHMNFMYFCVSYIDIDNDRFLKHQINILIQDHAHTIGRPSLNRTHFPFRRIGKDTPIDTALPFNSTGDNYVRSLDPSLLGKRIAVPCQFWFRRHSLYRTFIRYAKALKQLGFKLQLLAIGKKQPDMGVDDEDASLFEEGVQYFDHPSDLDKAKAIEEALIRDPVDAVFYPEVGMSWVSTYLSNLRLAPVQFTVQGHSVSTFGSMIDFYFSGDETEPFVHQVAAREFSEMLVLLPGLGVVNRSPGYLYRPRWRTQPVSHVQPLDQFSSYASVTNSSETICKSRGMSLILNHAAHKINHEYLCHVARALPRIFKRDKIEVKFFPGFSSKLERDSFERVVNTTLLECYIREAMNVIAIENSVPIRGTYIGDIHDFGVTTSEQANMNGLNESLVFSSSADIDINVDETEGGETLMSYYPTGSEDESRLHRREAISALVWGMPEARRRVRERASRLNAKLSEIWLNRDPKSQSESKPLTDRLFNLWKDQLEQIRTANETASKFEINIFDLLRADFANRIAIKIFPQLKYNQYLGEISAHVETSAERAGCFFQIALEAFPFGGCNTVIDSVWAGVPVVAFEGRRYNARVGTAILRRLSPSLSRSLSTRNKRVFVKRIVELSEDDSFRREVERVIRGSRLEPLFGSNTGEFESRQLTHPDQILLPSGESLSKANPKLLPKSVIFENTTAALSVPWRRVQFPRFDLCPQKVSEELALANKGELYNADHSSFEAAEYVALQDLLEISELENEHIKILKGANAQEDLDLVIKPVEDDSDDNFDMMQKFATPVKSETPRNEAKSESSCATRRVQLLQTINRPVESQPNTDNSGVDAVLSDFNSIVVNSDPADPFALDLDDDIEDSTDGSTLLPREISEDCAQQTSETESSINFNEDVQKEDDSNELGNQNSTADRSSIDPNLETAQLKKTIPIYSLEKPYLYPTSDLARLAVLRAQWLRRRARGALKRLESVQRVRHAEKVRQLRYGIRKAPITPVHPPDCAFPFRQQAFGANLGPTHLPGVIQGGKISPLWIYRRAGWPQHHIQNGKMPPFSATIGGEDSESRTLESEFKISEEHASELVKPISTDESTLAGPEAPIGMMPDGTLYRTRSGNPTPILSEEDYFALAVKHLIDYNIPLQRIVYNSRHTNMNPPPLDWAKFIVGESRSNPDRGSMIIPKDPLPELGTGDLPLKDEL